MRGIEGLQRGFHRWLMVCAVVAIGLATVFPAIAQHGLIVSGGGGVSSESCGSAQPGHGAGAKYNRLLKTIAVEKDKDNYGEFHDYGYWNGTSYAGHENLPPGYWVYVTPNWHIFGDARLASSAPLAPRAPAEKRSWGPEQACGAPDTQQAGDIVTAWASRTSDGQDEWLRLHYRTPIVPSAVHVYETYNPGALSRITARKPNGEEVELWSGTDPVKRDEGRGVAKIAVRSDFATDCITLYLKSKDVPGWNEIDAVGLRDAAEKVHWATSAEASSTFAEFSGHDGIWIQTDRQRLDQLEAEVAELKRRLDQRYPATSGKQSWSPAQACGAPDTHQAGDISTAWASATPDDQDEWLRLHYEKAVVPAAVHVYETYNPGAVSRITARRDSGEDVEIWSGVDPVDRASGKGIANIPVRADFPTKCITIHVKSKEVRGWNEIDAVGLMDRGGNLQWATSAEASSSFGR